MLFYGRAGSIVAHRVAAKLIGMIRGLNPNVQLILTTHSPAVIMEGWLDAVTEVEDISTVIGGR